VRFINLSAYIALAIAFTTLLSVTSGKSLFLVGFIVLAMAFAAAIFIFTVTVLISYPVVRERFQERPPHY